MELPEPTVDDLKDEVENITAHLIERFEMTARGVRNVVRKAVRTGKCRPQPECNGFRVVNAEDLLHDLESCAIQLGASRIAMNAVGRGIRAVTA